jgi:hypothetical protein
LQETKAQFFDSSTIRKMDPNRFGRFDYVLSEGASGVILVGWNNAMFAGEVMSKSKFQITMKFTTAHNAEVWFLTAVYGPCHGQDR